MSWREKREEIRVLAEAGVEAELIFSTLFFGGYDHTTAASKLIVSEIQRVANTPKGGELEALRALAKAFGYACSRRDTYDRQEALRLAEHAYQEYLEIVK